MNLQYFLPLLSFVLISCGDSTNKSEDMSLNDSDDNITLVELLFKTGQTTSYTANDDGTYQIGSERQYTKLGSVVYEKTKDTYWQDSSDVTQKFFTYSEAQMYCYYLIEDGYEDWRLPTIYEAMSLINYAKTSPALDSAFENSGSGYLWTSTPCPVCNAKSFAYEEVSGNFASFSETDNQFHTRCVRENTAFKKNLTRDDTKEVVIDSNASLMWQDDSAVNKNNIMTFENAINYCENLELAEYSDWRLPNAIELRTLLDFTGFTGSAHSAEFINLGIDYWSSTTVADTNGEKAWNVQFYAGTSKSSLKDSKFSARCIRTMER